MEKKITLLAVNTGSIDTTSVALEKREFTQPEFGKIKVIVLELLNSMGKSSHVLIKNHDGKLFTAHHTAMRGPSTEYSKAEVRYHPYAGQLS